MAQSAWAEESGWLPLPAELLAEFESPSTPLPAWHDDLADGRLDRCTLAEVALEIDGPADPQVRAQLLDRLSWEVALLGPQVRDVGTAAQRAKRLFALMHQRLLTGGYRLEASSLSGLLETGQYNCLSATLLWLHLCRACNVPAEALQLPGHVRSRLLLPDGPLNVEATCLGWFEHTAAERATALVPGPPRPLNDAQLAAAVYYNRAVWLLAERQFAAALTAGVRAHRLDPEHDPARANLLAAINNWAVALADEGQFARAIRLLDLGQKASPDHQNFALNYVALHQNWIEHLIAQGRGDEALELAERLHRQLPAQPYFAAAVSQLRDDQAAK